MLQNCRLQAFVPATVAYKFKRLIEEGKFYVIKNFQVKDYTELEKFRAVQMDKQIVFTNDTKVKDVEETEIFIPRNSFDFFDFGDLIQMSKQSLYLAGK